MTHEVKDFANYAKAERQLCDAAAPLLADIIGAIKSDTSVVITEVRVTFVHTNSSSKGISTNCTIVQAHLPTRQVDLESPPPPNAGAGVAGGRDRGSAIE